MITEPLILTCRLGHKQSTTPGNVQVVDVCGGWHVVWTCNICRTSNAARRCREHAINLRDQGATEVDPGTANEWADQYARDEYGRLDEETVAAWQITGDDLHRWIDTEVTP